MQRSVCFDEVGESGRDACEGGVKVAKVGWTRLKMIEVKKILFLTILQCSSKLLGPTQGGFMGGGLLYGGGL